MGLSFGEELIKLVEWNFNDNPKWPPKERLTSKNGVLEQVLFGLDEINKATNKIGGATYTQANPFFVTDCAKKERYSLLV